MNLIFQNRQTNLKTQMQQTGLDLICLNPGPTLTYLTGLDFHLMERPVVLFFSTIDKPVIVIPDFEKVKLQNYIDITSITYSEDPSTWLETFQTVKSHISTSPSSIGVEELQMRVFELGFIQQIFPKTTISSCQPLIASLRLSKDELEIQHIRQAIRIAEEALTNTLPFIKPGITEREIAGELTLQLMRAGSDPQLPFPPIVASGPNSANPHAVPSDRSLQPGDSLIIDWGARYHGYISDLTRTFSIGKISSTLSQIYPIVAAANQAGRQFSRPHLRAEEVDIHVRHVVEASGYGAFFTHRTGHGIGLEPHEDPYIRNGNSQILQPGMTFTIEPGIYIPGDSGVRIEDNVVITTNGAETLSSFSRDLVVL